MARNVLELIAIGTAVFIVAHAPPAHADGQRTCQWTTMGDGSQVQMCKGLNGKWHPSDAVEAPAQGVHESDFPLHAEVTYIGNWAASASTAPHLNLRSLNLGSVVRQSLDTRNKDISGPVTLIVTFSGQKINSVLSGRYFRNQAMTGTIMDGYCWLAQTAGPDTIEGHCGKDGFLGTIKGKSTDGYSFSGSFESSSVNFVDLDQRAREQAAAERTQQANIAAAEAKIRNAPAAGPVLTRKLDSFVRTDSRGWAFNHYDDGSINNVKVIDGSVKSGHYTLRGEYTYNGGVRGWVLAQMSGPNLGCIQFHDAMIGCRGLRTPEQGIEMRNAANNALLGTGGPSSGSQSGMMSENDARAQAFQIRQYNDEVRQQQQDH